MNRLLILTPNAEDFRQQVAACELPDLEIVACTTLEEAAQAIQDCNLALARPTMLADALPYAARLEWAQSTWAGVELLCAPGLRRDYRLTGVKGVFGAHISEYVFGYILALERNLFETRANQLASHWEKIPYRSLQGLVLGVMGLGSIGEHLAGTATHFGMRVLGYRRSPGEHPLVERLYSGGELAEFLGQLDYLVLALPNTPATDGLMDASALAAMKPEAVLVNIGRGNAIDESALAQALQCGRLKAAVLDVFVEEPLPPESPLWRLPNAYLTPHNAANSFAQDIVHIFCQNYQRFLNGEELLYTIDFERGY